MGALRQNLLNWWNKLIRNNPSDGWDANFLYPSDGFLNLRQIINDQLSITPSFRVGIKMPTPSGIYPRNPLVGLKPIFVINLETPP